MCLATANTGLWAALDRLGLTHKKVLRAAEQDREDVARARVEWRKRQPGLDPKRLARVCKGMTFRWCEPMLVR